MARRPRDPEAGPFDAVDLSLVDLIASHDAALRSVLCTLARRGVAFRLAAPERAARWIDALSVHPYYKGGQFLFDLLEWEDFMLDGPPPPLLDAARLATILNALASRLQALRAAIDPEAPPWVVTLAAEPGDPGRLPPLEAGFYLYRDVVLGVLSVIRSATRPG